MNVTKLVPEGVRIELTDDETKTLNEALEGGWDPFHAQILADLYDSIKYAYRNTGEKETAE